jgi:aminoglycoside 3-N-acetyltransferase
MGHRIPRWELTMAEISILMPVYNRADFLEEVIPAVLNEEFSDFELLICDDASTDQSYRIVQAFAQKDSRIRAFRREANSGRPGIVYQFLAKQATGNYLIASDSDDLCLPRRLKVLHAAAESNPDVSIAYGKTRVVDQTNGSLLGWYQETFDAAKLFRSNYVPDGAALLRRSIFDRVRGYDESITWAEDYDLRLRMALEGRFLYVDEEVYVYRLHPKNWTAIAKNEGEEAVFKEAVIRRCVRHLDDVAQTGRFSHTSRVALAYCTAYQQMQQGVKAPHAKKKARGLRKFIRWLGSEGRDSLDAGFRRLGVRRGMTVVVHSSLSSFGHVRGGAQTVIDSIKGAITSDGKVIMPTFTYQSGYGTAAPRDIVPQKGFTLEMPVVRDVGVIPETFRRNGDVFRCHHPIFSFAFWGQGAEQLAAKYSMADSLTPESPLGEVLGDDGYLLLLGVDFSVASLLHAAEYAADVPYAGYQSYFGLRGENGSDQIVRLRTTGHSEEFRKLEGILLSKSVPHRTEIIGTAVCRLVKAKELFKVAVMLLRSQPDIFLCVNDQCVTCRERRIFFGSERPPPPHDPPGGR